MQSSPGSYPLTFSVDPPAELARWRPLVAWLLVIPHLLVLYVVGAVAGVCAFIAWFAILFTGKMPEGLAGLITMSIRYQARATTYAIFLREEYPPFLFTGRWPEGLREFVLGYLRWSVRVSGYAMLLTDEYPPFSTS